MSDIKLVLYKENRTPRTIALSSRMVYRTLVAVVLFAALFIAVTGLATRFYWLSKARLAQPTLTDTAPSSAVSGDLAEQNVALRDEVDQLKSKLKNAANIAAASKEIDNGAPVLSLFAPIVSDKTKEQDTISIQNFKYAPTNGNQPATLTFELHNSKAGENAIKGYIVVLGRSSNTLQAYPKVFTSAGPFLLDFEKGETFQVARFRLVNATFDEEAEKFQVLIFTRNGELLINSYYEVKGGGAS